MDSSGRCASIYKLRTYNFANKWLVRPCMWALMRHTRVGPCSDKASKWAARYVPTHHARHLNLASGTSLQNPKKTAVKVIKNSRPLRDNFAPVPLLLRRWILNGDTNAFELGTDHLELILAAINQGRPKQVLQHFDGRLDNRTELWK
jgi:hypothetical protein